MLDILLILCSRYTRDDWGDYFWEELIQKKWVTIDIIPSAFQVKNSDGNLFLTMCMAGIVIESQKLMTNRLSDLVKGAKHWMIGFYLSCTTSLPFAVLIKLPLYSISPSLFLLPFGIIHICFLKIKQVILLEWELYDSHEFSQIYNSGVKNRACVFVDTQEMFVEEQCPLDVCLNE